MSFCGAWIRPNQTREWSVPVFPHSTAHCKPCPMLLPRPQLTPEQLAQGEALAKAYQKGMNARAHRHRVDLNHKQEMKACAIAALPTEELQVDAMLVDDPTVPLMLRLPTVTPPHAGWHRPDNVLFLSPEEEEAIATREAKTATGVVTGSAAGEGWDEDR